MALLVATSKDVCDVPAVVEQEKCPEELDGYLVRDIVSDIRFYSVMKRESFYIEYAVFRIEQLVDNITEAEWGDENLIQERRENFLNHWFQHLLLPLDEVETTIIKKMLEEKRETIKRASRFTVKGKACNKSENYKEESYDVEEWDEIMGVQDCTHVPMRYEPLDFLSEMLGTALDPEILEYDTDVDYLSKLDETLIKLAEWLGHCSADTSSHLPMSYKPATKSDISGITVGNNLNALLPLEIALLSERTTEDIFYKRYTEKKLQMFSARSESLVSKGKEEHLGPIFICVDTSSSMEGSEMMAKKLALAVAFIAQKKQRPLFVMNYSFSIFFFALYNLQKQWGNFINFLSRSHSGKNDENRLFHFLFQDLPTLQRYSNMVRDFENADLLMISDFQWERLSKQSVEYLQQAKVRGMRFCGLYVNAYDNASFWSDFTSVSTKEINNGEDFFRFCDAHYVYQNERCIRLDEE